MLSGPLSHRWFAVCAALLIARQGAAQEGLVHVGADVDSLLLERAGIAITMPDGGYSWSGVRRTSRGPLKRGRSGCSTRR
jgi:hypothetical protein